jgi:Flp pilus assembly protein CpaB
MKFSIIAVVVLGLIAAACMAGIVGYLPAFLRNPGRATSRPAPEVSVLVTAKDLSAMQIINADCVAIKKIPPNAVPKEHLTDRVQAIGKVLILPMSEGQAFTAGSFVSEGSGAQLAAALPNGKRAVAILLDNDASLRSLLYPGCTVDVIASRKGGSNTDATARTLLQNIQVIAVEDRTIVSAEKGKQESATVQKELGRKSLVTLMVDPEQARLLQAAQRDGTVSLTMRNPLDTTRPLEAVNDQPTTEPAAAPNPVSVSGLRTWEMTIIRDGKSELRKFELTGTRQ